MNFTDHHHTERHQLRAWYTPEGRGFIRMVIVVWLMGIRAAAEVWSSR